MDAIDPKMKIKSVETALKMEDQRTMQSYNIFKFLPDPESGVRVPFLYLELSKQPVLLTISPSLSAAAQDPGEEMKHQMALSQAVVENGPTENNRNKVNQGADVGGSATHNPSAEDIELEVYTTCSIYCVKYILWRRFQTPI